VEGLYIGRRVDPASLDVTGDAALLDADRLTRHAVCLGMTGSGKTGLCVTLLEELAMAGVPALVIDPKGDMTNLCLAFAAQRPEDFEPWVDPQAAEREGLDTAEYARRTAKRWHDGLQEWGLDDARVRRFTDGVQVTVYTPGSTSGVPVDVLSALAAPPPGLLEDEEGLRDLVAGTVGSLLGLVGVEADPVSDPSHIVLSRVVEDLWRQGQPADLETLIPRLVDPPFAKVGVFPVDTFYPRGERMKLAMQLNGIVASPAFSAWREGAPLDIDTLLAERDGRTPLGVFYLSHLDQARRMFFLSTLLDRVVAWSRRQAGTSALRALVYFDEVYGYLPPHPRNPPTKHAVLTLMKQARAVGVGTMLVTQNPVDIDYKALSNAGTWLVGRLQTAQDRERVLDGLTTAAGGFDRGTVGGWLEDLPSRTFVWRDVQEDEPSLVHSRWAISYLRGPLTRREIEALPPEHRTLPEGVAPAPVEAAPAGAAPERTAPAAPPPDVGGLLDAPPRPPEGYAQRFLDPAVAFSARLRPFFEGAALPARGDGRTVWQPALLGTLQVRFDEGDFVEDRTESRLFFPITDAGLTDAGDPGLAEGDLLDAPAEGGLFAPLPVRIDEAKELKGLEKRVVDAIWRGETSKLFRHAALKLESTAGETREAFDGRVAAAIQDRIDAEVAKLEEDVDKKVDRLEERRRKLEQDRDKWSAEVRSRKASELVSAGQTLYGLFFGGRRKSLGTAVTRRQQTMRAEEKATRAGQDIAKLEQDVAALDNQTRDQIGAIEAEWRARAGEVEEVEVRLERDDVQLRDFGILWVPVTPGTPR